MKPRTVRRDFGQAGAGLALMAGGLILLVQGCASCGSGCNRCGSGAAMASERSTAEDLSPWDRERKDQERRLADDRGRYARGERSSSR